MDLNECSEMASGVAAQLESDAMASLEEAIGHTTEMVEFIESLHGVLATEQSGQVHEIVGELQTLANTALETASKTQEKASTLAGALAAMRG